MISWEWVLLGGALFPHTNVIPKKFIQSWRNIIVGWVNYVGLGELTASLAARGRVSGWALRGGATAPQQCHSVKVFNCFNSVNSVKLFCIALHWCTLYCLGLLYFSHFELLLLWTAHPSTALSIEQCNLILCSALTCTALSRASLQGRTKLSPITTQECALRHRSPCNTMQLF